MTAPTLLDPAVLPITPPMDLTGSSDTEPISSRPLQLRTDRGLGLFGIRRQPFANGFPGIRTHIGVDLLAPADQPVFATAPGVVVQNVEVSYPNGAKDRSITIHHEPFELGWVSSYRHLQTELISAFEGQPVESGQQLGVVAPTDTQPFPEHLQFEVRQVFNEMLLNEYLSIYRAGPTRPSPIDLGGSGPITFFDLSGFSDRQNIANTQHSLPLDPTRVLYDWENRLFKNDDDARRGHVLQRVVISKFREVWRDRLRFILVNVQGSGRDFYIPLLGVTDAEMSMMQTLRHAFNKGSSINLVWRESLFFGQIANNQLVPRIGIPRSQFADIIVEVTVLD